LEGNVSRGDYMNNRWTWKAWAIVASIILVIMIASGISVVVREGVLGDGCVWIANWIVPICCFIMLLLVLIFHNKLKSL